mmetsp:Transcript_13860/g.29638  ORF Transcript_13860/g.29638 Transcript_13860/m.29638 type:complete len:201 (+) Transcript_13860:2479-3081(+)
MSINVKHMSKQSNGALSSPRRTNGHGISRCCWSLFGLTIAGVLAVHVNLWSLLLCNSLLPLLLFPWSGHKRLERNYLAFHIYYRHVIIYVDRCIVDVIINNLDVGTPQRWSGISACGRGLVLGGSLENPSLLAILFLNFVLGEGMRYRRNQFVVNNSIRRTTEAGIVSSLLGSRTNACVVATTSFNLFYRRIDRVCGTHR